MQHDRTRSLKLRGRILLLFGICMLFMVAAACLGFWQFASSIRIFDQEVGSSQTSALQIEAAETAFKKQVQEWKDTLLRGKKPEAFDKYWSAFQQREAEVHDLTEGMIYSVGDSEASQLLAQFVAAHKKMGEAYRRGLDQFKGHDFDSAIGDGAVAGMDRAPTELLTKAKDRLLSVADMRAGEARQQARQTTWMMTLLLAVVTVASIAAFMVVVQKSISLPLTRAVEGLAALSGGDTTVEVSGAKRGDEIGSLAKALLLLKQEMIAADRLRSEQSAIEQRQSEQRKAEMNRLADSFEIAVGEIVETVSTASSELERSANSLTVTAFRAQEVTNTVASASEEASSNVQSVASSTEELSSSVNEISRQVQESARIANEAVDQARNTNDRVGELSKAASRIGDVVELINNIAGQTNLLALNATIEAARAGEAGRGFAVVASEVKALAEQTAKATGEIGQHINGIQTATQESVGAIKEISSTIERLSEISSTIAAAVEEQGAATKEISRNVQQAAHGTQQVSSNIADVQRGAGDTGLASSQVLSAAQSLSAESNRLKLEVGKFVNSVRVT